MQLHTGTYSSIQLHTSLVSVSIKTFQPPKHNKSTRSIRHHVIFHIKWLGTGLLESARSGRCLIQTSSCRPFGMRGFQSCHSCCRFSNASQNMFLEKKQQKKVSFLKYGSFSQQTGAPWPNSKYQDPKLRKFILDPSRHGLESTACLHFGRWREWSGKSFPRQLVLNVVAGRNLWARLTVDYPTSRATTISES